MKAGLASKNVAAEIDRRRELPEAGEAEQKYLTDTQLLDLARAAGRFETLTLILGYCGLRISEAAALRRKHVGDRELTIMASATAVAREGIVESGTKTRRTRRVPVPEPVWDRLKSELPTESDMLVFPSRKVGYLPLGEYRWAFDAALRTVQEACKAKRQHEIAVSGEATTPDFATITPHALRHTCASLAISEGANVKVVQRLLGHASATMTLDRYGHLMSDDFCRGGGRTR